MIVRGVVEGSASTRHAVRVDWFRRDPGGGTLFILPAESEGAVPQPIVEHGEDTAVSQG